MNTDPIFEIKTEQEDNNYGRFVISPLLAGYGMTLGTALRRVLLTSLPGAAITAVSIEGVKHQFSTLKGMGEDMLDFCLNLKKVAVSYSGTDPVKATISAKGPGEVKASDIKLPTGASVVNPDLVIAHLAQGAKLSAELTIESGVGYVLAEEHEQTEIGYIHLDANYSPVVRVTPKVEETRVGRVTNYDKLTLEVWTNGAVSPSEALKESAKILSKYLSHLLDPVVKPQSQAVAAPQSASLNSSVGKLSVEELGLPTRVANALIKSGYETVEKLIAAPRSSLLTVRNVGEKSLDMINELLAEKGVRLSDA